MNTTQTHAERAAEEINHGGCVHDPFVFFDQEKATAIIARACDASVAEYRDSLYNLMTWAETYKRAAKLDNDGPLSSDIERARALLTRNTQQDTK